MSAEVPAGADLSELYGAPSPLVLKAVTNHITEYHIQYLAVATFFCFATGCNNGLDVSPRGGPPGFAKVLGPRRIAFADWPGNNRIESLKNIQKHRYVGLCFLFPGLEIFLRINGQASVSTDPALLASVAQGQRIPKTATLIEVEEVLFHCGKAINRAALWSPSSLIDRKSLPSAGTVISALAQVKDIPVETLDQQYDHEMKHGLY